MHDEYRQHIKRALIQGGIKARYVQRTLLELDDHYQDLTAEARDAGLTPDQARLEAESRLGDPAVLAQSMLCQDTLKVPTARWKSLDQLLRSLLFLLVMPLAPALLCVGRGPVIAKWGVAITASAMLTIGMLLGLGILLVG